MIMSYLGMKSFSSFNFSLVFVSQIMINFHYKRMTKKIDDNLQEKYKDFQILKMCKIKTLVRLAILILI